MNIVDQLLANSSALDQILSESWTAPAGPLATALGLAEQRRIVGGHDVLDLATRGRVWLVLSGSVQLFLTDHHGRYPVTEIKGGGLIDSFSSADPNVKIVGVPDPGTEVAETSRSALAALATRPTEATSLAEAWKDWFETLKRLLPAGRWAPDAVDGKDFDKICDTAADAFLAEMVVRREADLRQRTVDRKAAEQLAERDFQHGLDGVVDLVGVATAAEREEAPTIAAAATRVARALGINDLSLRRAAVQHRPLAEAVPEICQDNRLQFRAVVLEGDWWTADHGPLLGSFGPDATPCALLRVGKRYRLHAGGTPRIVDAKLGGTIDRTAYSLYAPFPNVDLTGWRLLRFGLLGGRRDVVTICFTLLLIGLFSLVTPLAAGWLMDPIIPDAQHDQVLVIAGLLFLLAIGMTASYLVSGLASLRLESMADNRVQAATWVRVLNLRPPFFRRYTAGDLANRADGINAMRRLVSQSTNTLGSGVTGAVFSLALLVYYEWRVALLVTLVCIVFGGLAYLVGRRVLQYNFESLDVAGRLEGTVLQLLGAIAKLRIAGAEHQAFLRWLSIYRRSVELSLRQRILANRLLVARSGFGPLITVLVLVVLGVHSGDLFAFFHSVNKHEVHKPLMSTADFVSFNVALGQLIMAAMSLTRSSLFLAMLQPYYRRVRPILEAPLESVGVGGHIEALQGELELRDVRFRYTPDSPLALRGLTMKIPAGKFVALVGPSGAGKTSIVRLLLGFDEPESGDIYVDGTDIRLLDLQEMRRHFGVVLQNGRLLAGSIYDNVCAGLPLPPEDVMEALRIAGLDEVVKTLPMGLYTNVADGGAAFSGGQRQRLLIARAVLRRPQVLILDEATSALDNVTQRTVVENLRELGCTQVVVAQRLSTIESADLIYVLNEGRVVESGTYLELLQKGPLFKQLAERQLL